MGVEFLICTMCNETFPDCGAFEHCAGCGRNFCTECGKGYVFELDYEDDDRKDVPITCPVCTLAFVPDRRLLEFALRRLGLTKEQLIEEYRTAKKAS